MGAPLLERLEAGGVGLLLLAHVPVGEEDTGKEVEGERKRREEKGRQGNREGQEQQEGEEEGLLGLPCQLCFLGGQLSAPALGAALSSFCLMAGPVHSRRRPDFRDLRVFCLAGVFLPA